MPAFSGCICVSRWVVCKCDFKNHLAAALHAGSVEHPELYNADWVFGSLHCRPVWVAWLIVDGHCAMLCYMQGELTNTISLIMAAVTLSTSHACVCVCECETDGPHKLSTVWLRECVSEMSAQSVRSLMIRFVRWHTQVWHITVLCCDNSPAQWHCKNMKKHSSFCFFTLFL